MECLPIVVVVQAIGLMKLSFFRGGFPGGASGYANGHAVGRDDGSGRYYGSGCHDCARADLRAVEDERADTDESIVVDNAPVKHCAVPDNDTVAYVKRKSSTCDVQHAEILDVGVFSDPDVIYVTACNCMEPEVRAGSDFHVSQDNHSGGEEYIFAQPRVNTLIG